MISGDSTASHMGSVKNIEKARERRTFETMPGSSQAGVPDDLLQHAETVHPRMGYDMSDSIFMQEMQAADRQKETKKALEERSALEAFRAAAIQKHFERSAPGKSGGKSDPGRGAEGDGLADDAEDKGKEQRDGGPPPPIAGIKIRKKKRQPQPQQPRPQRKQQKQALDEGESCTREGSTRDTPHADRGTKRTVVPSDSHGAAEDRGKGEDEEEGRRVGSTFNGEKIKKKTDGESENSAGGKPPSSSGGQTAGGVNVFVASAAKGDVSAHPPVGKPAEAGSRDGSRDAAGAGGLGFGLVAYSSGDDDDDSDSRDV